MFNRGPWSRSATHLFADILSDNDYQPLKEEALFIWICNDGKYGFAMIDDNPSRVVFRINLKGFKPKTGDRVTIEIKNILLSNTFDKDIDSWSTRDPEGKNIRVNGRVPVNSSIFFTSTSPSQELINDPSVTLNGTVIKSFLYTVIKCNMVEKLRAKFNLVYLWKDCYNDWVLLGTNRYHASFKQIDWPKRITIDTSSAGSKGMYSATRVSEKKFMCNGLNGHISIVFPDKEYADKWCPKRIWWNGRCHIAYEFE